MIINVVWQGILILITIQTVKTLLSSNLYDLLFIGVLYRVFVLAWKPSGFITISIDFIATLKNRWFILSSFPQIQSLHIYSTLGQNSAFQYKSIVLNHDWIGICGRFKYTLIKTIHFFQINMTILSNMYMVQEYVWYSWPKIHTLRVWFSMYKRRPTFFTIPHDGVFNQ